jgi:hypothetical protein
MAEIRRANASVTVLSKEIRANFDFAPMLGTED